LSERLTQWDPVKAIEEVRDEMARLWGDSWPFGPLATTPRLRHLLPTPSMWVPRIDVFEKDGQLVVKAELPGMKKEEIEVGFDGGDLTIKGERKAETEVKEDAYYRVERSHGRFYRRIPMPEGVNPDKIEATYNHGVLEIRVPMPTAAAHQTQKIKIG
jgi:HSP20 family protein